MDDLMTAARIWWCRVLLRGLLREWDRLHAERLGYDARLQETVDACRQLERRIDSLKQRKSLRQYRLRM